MPNFEISDLINSFHRRLRGVPRHFTRYLAKCIDWDDRLIGIRGARGTGKTTLILQHILNERQEGANCLYASLDHLWFTNHSLEELAEYHVQHNGTHLYLDEIHHLDHWQTALKNLYDDFPNLKIVYTGSSLLKIDSAAGDLSRRQILYTLPTLSFREYLELEAGLVFPVYSLYEILAEHTDIAPKLTSRFPLGSMFEKYLKCGCYPFYKEVKSGFELRLQQIVNQVLESDYPALENISISTIWKTKRMLQVLAENVPQTPNQIQLCAELETDRNQILKMLDALSRAGLLGLLSKRTKNLKHLGWPEKILMQNTNLMYALGVSVNEGTLRETFFLNQLSTHHAVNSYERGDFLVDGKYLFEVGGRRKSFRQIQDMSDSFLAIDDLEIGHGNRIPLWLFGFMY